MSQRWHEWRNMHGTTCPSFGVVRLIIPQEGSIPGGGTVDPSPVANFPYGPNQSENEVCGGTLIMHGSRPNYDFDADSTYPHARHRGFSPNYAINGASPVEPGQLGLLTFDLPAWVKVDAAPRPTVGVSNFVTVFDDWIAHFHDPSSDPGQRELQQNTGILYVFGFDSVNMLAFVGMGISYQIDGEII